MKAVLTCLLMMLATPALADTAPNTGLDKQDLQWINRLTWGINRASATQYRQLGADAWLDGQMHFIGDQGLPDSVRQRIDAMPISRTPLTELVIERRQLEQQINSTADPDQKAALRKSANQQANNLALQSAERDVLRDIYSSNQLQEVMTWFWFNHFNVLRHKGLDNLLSLIHI